MYLVLPSFRTRSTQQRRNFLSCANRSRFSFAELDETVRRNRSRFTGLNLVFFCFFLLETSFERHEPMKLSLSLGRLIRFRRRFFDGSDWLSGWVRLG